MESRNYRKNILSMMTNSDILEMLEEKREELKGFLKWHKKVISKFSRKKNSEYYLFVVEYVFEFDEKIKTMEKTIKFFKYELIKRNPFHEKGSTITLDELKSRIDIVQLVEMLSGEHLSNPRHLIKCPFPSHRDSSASFKIYPNTDSFYCFGCHQGGDQISFIENMAGCSTKEAIRKLQSITNE